MDKVIIEVGLNENQDRSANRHVPYTAGELADTAGRCYDAGASIVHFHGRLESGAPALSDAALNLEAQRAITEAAPVITYPSYGSETRVLDYYDIGTPAPQRFAHLSAIAESGTRLEVAPVDLGTFDSNVRWDAAAAQLVPSTGMLMNTGEDQRWILEFCDRNGIKPHFTTFDTNHLQNLRNLVDWGWTGTSPLFVKLFLAGVSAQPAVLLFYREQMRELFSDTPMLWMPLVYGSDQFPLCTLALALGGHVRVGIGDYHYRDRNEPTNASLVERIVTISRAFGREPATPDETRALTGIVRSPPSLE